LETPVVGVLLVICTTEFSTCLNIVLRDKGLEEELVPWEEVALEFNCSCCATAVDGSINPLNGIVIIIATANTTAVANANRLLNRAVEDYSSNLSLCTKSRVRKIHL